MTTVRLLADQYNKRPSRGNGTHPGFGTSKESISRPATAAAIYLARIGSWLRERTREVTRTTPFARLNDATAARLADSPAGSPQGGRGRSWDVTPAASPLLLIVDEATRFVYQDSNGSQADGAGTEFWPFTPRTRPVGLTVPGVRVECRFHGGKTDVSWVRSIESIDQVSPVPQETFTASVPAGTLILDYRVGRGDVYRGVMRGPVTDVVTRADEIAATR